MQLNPLALMREEFDGTGIVFDPENNKAMSLNVSGVTIWKALAEECTIDKAVDAIMKKFSNVTIEQAEADVRSFMDLLAEKGLLDKCNG